MVIQRDDFNSFDRSQEVTRGMTIAVIPIFPSDKITGDTFKLFINWIGDLC